MDAAQFLARVVPAGNYVAVCFKGVDARFMGVRFFPRGELDSAAGFIRWCAGNRCDVWYGLASYRIAHTNPKGKLTGHRTQENVQALRSFWLDLDIKRDGDGKADGRAYADIPAAVTWLKKFCAATGLPLPNLWMSSGYGLHLYWVLEDAIAPAVWQPYAEGLKAALIAHDAIGDIGLSADSARILRPPQTLNLKAPSRPVPVQVLRQSAEYPNQIVYDKLQPYIGLAVKTAASVGNYGSAGLTGSPPMLAQRAAAVPLAASQTNLSTVRREYLFANIAGECQQVKQSLANGGLGDGYDLWYRGHLTLAHFCADGAGHAHEISKGDPRYTQAAIDSQLQRVATEQQRKNLGAPLCSSYNTYRPGVCSKCQHFGKINTPYTLGLDGNDLPDGYKRGPNAVLRRVVKNNQEDWTRLVEGDVYAPVLDRTGDAYTLTFTYELAGRRSYVVVDQSSMPSDNGRLAQIFGRMGVVLYGDDNNQLLRFAVAWITKLRMQCAIRDASVPPFGWAKDSAGQYIGFAFGGMLYKLDGTTETAPGGDARITDMYRPRGDLQVWKDACGFVIKDRPDLQVLIAASFGAPLMEFTGQTGVTLSAWSRDSGVGKSSALKVGQAVWGTFKAMCSMHDTHNAARKIIAATKVMPCYWDEMRVDDDRSRDMLDLFFEVAQGKDKARLNSDTSLRDIEEWKTILVTTSNRPFMDYIEQLQGTDANALRLFEFCIEHPQLGFDTEAARKITASEQSAGRAGEVYAAFIGRSPAVVESTVRKCAEHFHAQCNALGNERFYLAGMSCILAGATLARLCGLVDFDLPALRDFLRDRFEALRAKRSSNLTVSNGVTDLDKILGNFFADNAGEALVTTEFAGRGRVSKSFSIRRDPPTNKRLAFHIGQAERIVRIDRGVWDIWCRAHHLSPSDVFDQITARFSATTTRGIMGAGTNYSTGRVEYFSVPLLTPELSEYIYDFGRQVLKAQAQRGTP